MRLIYSAPETRRLFFKQMRQWNWVFGQKMILWASECRKEFPIDFTEQTFRDECLSVESQLWTKGWRKWRRGSSETCLEYKMSTRNKVSTRICYWCRKLLWLLPFLHKNAHYKIQVWVPRIEFFALEFMIGTYITLAMMPFWITEQQNYALQLRCDAAWRPREA